MSKGEARKLDRTDSPLNAGGRSERKAQKETKLSESEVDKILDEVVEDHPDLLEELAK